MKRRDAHLVLVSLSALGGGVTGALVPADMLDLASRASGLARILPAAAPPLGDTARLIFIGLSGLGATGLVMLLSPWKQRTRPEHTEDIMTYMASKYTALFRRSARRIERAEDMPATEAEAELAPAVRRIDAHPDAPPRAPLVVSRDLAGEASALMEEEPRGPIVQDITGLAMPRAPEPLPWEAIETEMSRLLETVRFRAVEEAPPGDLPEADTDAEPTITELAARLERGIARRRTAETDASSDLPAASSLPPPPERTAVLAVVSAMASLHAPPVEAGESASQPSDLETALAALRSLTARAC